MTISIKRILSIIFILSFIRIVSFAISFPNNFDKIWKPGNFQLFSTPLIIFIIITILFTIYKLVIELKKNSDRTKTSFFIYIAVMYLFLSFFNRVFLNIQCSYIHILEIAPVSFSDSLPYIYLDFFYEPPFTFWSILLMAIIYFIFKKANKLEYAVPFWIIPLSLLDFPCNDIILTMLFANCIIALLGFKYSENYKTNSLTLILLQFFINLFCIIYSHLIYNKSFDILSIAIQTLLIFYIPTFIILKLLINKTHNALSVTWILPLTTAFFLNLPLFRLPSHYCLTTFSAMMNSFLFLGNLSLLAGFIILIVYLIKKLLPYSDKFCFYILSFLAISFYSLDGILYYYSQFRINYQTLQWTKTMDNIIQTTLYTCLNYLSSTAVFSIVLYCFALLFFAKYTHKIIEKNPKLRLTLIIPLLTAQVSLTFLQISESIPRIFRDPFFELIKSFPNKKKISSKTTLEELKTEFEKCKIPLQEYKEQQPSVGNKTNVILITLESVHSRYLNILDNNEPKTWPKLSSLKDRMEIFPFIFCNYPESTCGDYALVSDLVPLDQNFIDDNPDAIYKTLVNEVKKANYNTYMFSSGSANDGRLINITKSMPLDYFSHYNSSNDDIKNNTWQWGYKEEYTSKKIIDYLNKRISNKPYFLWYRTVYPHAPFTLFTEFEKLTFKPKDNQPLDILTKYKNALVYIDSVLYDFVKEIDELDRKNNQKTMIVMVGDHGEMLEESDNKYLSGHGQFVSPYITNVACVVIKPDQKGLTINKNIGSQIDITPTILDYLDLKPSVKRYGQGQSLLTNNMASRTVYLSSIMSYALIEDGYFFEFPDKNQPNIMIKEILLSKNNKAEYKTIYKWPEEDIINKYKRAKKFFRLQEQLLNFL